MRQTLCICILSLALMGCQTDIPGTPELAPTIADPTVTPKPTPTIADPTDMPEPTSTVAAPPELLPCSLFDTSLWKEFSFGDDSPSDVISTVERLWDKEAGQVSTMSNYRDLFILWSDSVDGVHASYEAFFWREQEFMHVELQLYPAPTLSQVLDCLGAPEYHEATLAAGIEYSYHVVSLWYTEKGLIAGDVAFPPVLYRTVIDAEYRIGFFVFVAPGELEELISNAYFSGMTEWVYEYGTCIIRPWPGSIEAIEVYYDPIDLQCEPD